ncbi:hypothetical protein EGW08_020666 [Elysia chlorotica]|uniref:C2H2-type domain-containing protein n=1 Tax=Elysia chlorotica TaxID=188477 RepID=A0A3S0ZNI4_ELYCH|nr:hypothetical protein EGW08_020666 [Elysia chlorotica]
MAHKNGTLELQANSVSFLTHGSGDSHPSNPLIFGNGPSNSNIPSDLKMDNPTIVVVTHTGELLEDSKEGTNSFLTLETKREIIEALQRSGLENNEITTVVLEDPILENFAAAQSKSFKLKETEKTIVSSTYSAVISDDAPLYTRSDQPLLLQDVPVKGKSRGVGGLLSSNSNHLCMKVNGNQETDSDMKQVLNLLKTLHQDRERHEREQRRLLESMHQEKMAMFRQCLNVLKDVKENIFKCLDEKTGPPKGMKDSGAHISQDNLKQTIHEDAADFENLSVFENSIVRSLVKLEEPAVNEIADKKHICDVCGKTFARAIGLERHQRTHTGVKPYSCNICSMRFRLSNQMYEHKKAHHTGTPFMCDVCGKGFSHRSVMARHKHIHTGHRPHVCKVCGKRFSRSDDLKIHHRVHVKGWLCQCDICGKGFKHKVNLQRHMMIHEEIRHYKHWCDVCGKGFSSTSHLREHFLTHTGEKPFICDVCGKGCSSKTLLKRHKFSHTDEKPCKCNICGKGFITNAHVKRHKLSKHEDAKPYVCDLCNNVFESLHDLQIHSQIHVLG